MRGNLFKLYILAGILLIAAITNVTRASNYSIAKQPCNPNIDFLFESYLAQPVANTLGINSRRHDNDEYYNSRGEIGGDFIRAFKQIKRFLKGKTEDSDSFSDHFAEDILTLIIPILVISLLLILKLVDLFKNAKENLKKLNLKILFKWLTILTFVCSTILYILTLIILNSNDHIGKTTLQGNRLSQEYMVGFLITFITPIVLFLIYKYKIKNLESKN
jgi:hypothetical protein